MSLPIETSSVSGLALAAGLSVLSSTAVWAYQIDCAILLCLSGGWPSSAECTAARAVFIRRITPWPVEPPLQIWRCPMSVELERDHESPVTRFTRLIEELDVPLGSATVTVPSDPSSARVFASDLAEATKNDALVPEKVTLAATSDYSDANGTADIDISSPDFDFVRSIRVYDIDWRQQPHGDGDCRYIRDRVRIGSYGMQGEFAWRDVPVSLATAQNWLGFSTHSYEGCGSYGTFRGVGVEWRDYQGNHGFEVVRY